MHSAKPDHEFSPIRAANHAEHWREARSWLQRGLKLWTDGTLAGSDGPQPCAGWFCAPLETPFAKKDRLNDVLKSTDALQKAE
jgi:hypothetical protein